MNHFSIAFGTITAVVIGGALVLDHMTSNSSKTPRVAQSTLSTTESAAASHADVSVNTSENAKIAMAAGEAVDRSAPKESAPQATAATTEKNPPRKPASSSKSGPTIRSAAPAPSSESPSPPASVSTDNDNAPTTAKPANSPPDDQPASAPTAAPNASTESDTSK